MKNSKKLEKKIKEVNKEVFEEINPEKDLPVIEKQLDNFLKKFKRNIRKNSINTEIFVGGSFAKGTLIKKQGYDIDIFLRFDKKYSEKEISKLFPKTLKGFKKKKVKGSREYYQIKPAKNIILEIVPVLKTDNFENARNITDLSHLHVKYVNKKTKSKKLKKEIMLAKAFFSGCGCYGAESHIKGFSGYSIELLVIYYGSFLKTIKELSKKRKNKIVIDPEKQFKNKKRVLLDINASKLESPIVLIDPTYKTRNVLAALSNKTFEKFQKCCNNFLKNPKKEFFEKKKKNLNKIKKEAESLGRSFLLIRIDTKKQEGSVAGTKLLKFYNHLKKEINEYFQVMDSGFNYNQKKSAKCFFVIGNKKEKLFEGPRIKDVKNRALFEKKHESCFVKGKRIYSKGKVRVDPKKFLKKWEKNNKKKIKDMYITNLRVIE